jgi:hypothetical protein
MSGKYYMLVNPYIEGSASKVFKADNSLKAAKMAYESLSEYFNNSVHNFRFTLLKLKSDSVKTDDEKTNKFNLEQYGGSANNKRFNSSNFSHFTVSERPNKDKTIDYEIKVFGNKIENLEHLISNVMKIQTQFAKAKKSGKKVNRLSESPVSLNSADSEQSGSGSVSGSSDSSSNQSGSGSGSSDSSSNQSGSGSGSSDSSKSSSQSEQVGGNDTEYTSESYQLGGFEATNSQTSDSYNLIGGKKSKYDDDDEDDSPDYYVKKYFHDPISYWYYYPSLYSYDRLYLPTFISPLSFPYVIDINPSVSYNTGPANPTINVGL